MISAAERKAIGERFVTQWANRTPVALPNAKFDPVPDGQWVSMNIVDGDVRQLEIGGIKNTERVTGLLFLSIYVPRDTGDKAALELADSAAAIFEKQRVPVGSIGSILFRRGLVRDGGTDGKHYKKILSIPYQTDFLL